MNYALINNEIVENIFVCDDEKTAKSLFPGQVVIDISGAAVGIGWSYDGENFSEPVMPEPTHEELVAQADATKTYSLSIAASHISILQDAVDLEMATAEEAAALTAWKKYRVLLNRIDTSTAPDINWPEQPAT
jgi:hypothetical protein